MKKQTISSRIYMLVLYLFLYAPIVVLIVFSFNASKSRNVWAGFTLQWYQELFSNRLILGSFLTTVLLGLLAAVISTVIGTLAATGFHSMKRRTRSFWMRITYLPVVSPDIVTGVSLMLLYVILGLSFGMTTLLLSHITFNIPYVILNVLPKFRQMDANLYEAAQDLGCNPAQAFFKVVLPQIMPGVISGFLMAFTYSIDDFIISYFTSGPEAQTLPITIYSMTRKRVNPQVNALSAIIFLVVIVALFVVNMKDIRKSARRAKEKGRAVL